MGYMSPFPRGTRVSQVFGSNPNNGVNPRGGHTGTDYAVTVGTPVYAAADGVIEHSDWFRGYYNENPWWLTSMGGDTLVLNCGDDDYTFVYAHLSDSTAKVGDRVKKGQIIGYSGNTGTATTGPHCHVEGLPPRWNYQNGTYGRINTGTLFIEFPDEITLQGTIIKEEDVPLSNEEFDRIFRNSNENADRVMLDITAKLNAMAKLISPDIDEEALAKALLATGKITVEKAE